MNMTLKKKGYKIIAMVFVLLACTMLVAFKSSDSNVKYVRTNYVDDAHGKTLVIESIYELDEYFNANKEKHNLKHKEKVYSDTTIGFEDAIAEYDEEYFRDHNIVLVLLTECSGSIGHKVISVKTNGGIMEIKIERQVPEIGTCDMAGWHIIIETEKVSIDEIKVMVDEKEITK